METQKIVNLLNSSESEFLKFATTKNICSELNGRYLHYNPIKFLIKSIESILCDYSDSYILLTGNTAVTGTTAAAGDNPIRRNQPLTTATQAAFKTCTTELNDTFVDEADVINIAMPMYNLIEYSDNYLDTSGSLWGFKRDEAENNADVTNDDNAPLFKYKAGLITNTEADGTKNGVKIDAPLKYRINF